MPLTTLKTIAQNTWLHSGGGPSAGGVCLYMCDYVEGDPGTWNNPGTFANAVTKAQNFASGTAMMNYSKAKSLPGKGMTDLGLYQPSNAALANNSIYRVAMYIGQTSQTQGPWGMPNHAAIAITGNNQDIVYFEPNFGFFQPAQPGMNNREALEHFINTQYAGTQWMAKTFIYRNVRPINASAPLSF